MDPQVIAAMIAGCVSLIVAAISYYLTRQSLEREMYEREEQWQESFRADLRKELVKESTMRILEERLNTYGKLWESLKITSLYHFKRSINPTEEIQTLANELTVFAYSKTGLIMTDRSRQLLNYLRSGCGDFIKGQLKIDEVRDRAHLLKHSLRSDLGIEDYRYESEMNQIATSLGRVDDWKRS